MHFHPLNTPELGQNAEGSLSLGDWSRFPAVGSSDNTPSPHPSPSALGHHIPLGAPSYPIPSHLSSDPLPFPGGYLVILVAAGFSS